MSQLQVQEYATAIDLFSRFEPYVIESLQVEEVVNDLLHILLQEPDAPRDVAIPVNYRSKRNLLRALLNIRMPKLFHDNFLQKMDALLQSELKEKGIVDIAKLETVQVVFPDNRFSQSKKFILWKGDITKINADAIVNAANSEMLGCFQPLHACIDNAIHSAGGPQLRNDCDIIMSIQNELEKTGQSKITRAYNLPSRYILHTVGPVVRGGEEITKRQKDELASCYRSCLELANEIADIKTVVFCAISTGVFGFPKVEAAEIAVNTVNEWLESHENHIKTVVFNVFNEEDYEVYAKLFT